MRILLLTSEYPPYSWGGLGRYSYEVSQDLSNVYKLDVLNVPTYCLNSACIGNEPNLVENTSYGRVKGATHILNKEFVDIFNSKGNFRWDDFIDATKRIVNVIEEKLNHTFYDIIFVQDYYNSLIASFLVMEGFAKTIISVCHLPLYAGFTYFDKPKSDVVHQFLESILMRYSYKIVVPSAFTKRVLLQIYNVNPNDIIINPLGTRLYEVPKLQHNDNIYKKNNEKLEIISVARVTEQKGLHYMLDVITDLYYNNVDFRYTIIGKGPRERDFKALTSKCPARSKIRHIGSVNSDRDLVKYYYESDIYLSTSLYETFGLSILEAMACGCAVVAFRVGSIEERIKHGISGMLVEVNDIDGMVKKVVYLYNNPVKLSAMKCAASYDARTFTWKKHVDKLIKIFDGCSHG